MFQSSITCQEYMRFIDIAKTSKEKAKSMLVKYDSTVQGLLRQVIDCLYNGGLAPEAPFSSYECKIQTKMLNHEYDKR